MPFTQSWYIKDQIVRVEFSGELTVEDIVGSFIVSGRYLQKSQAECVHFVHDWSKLERLPTNVREIHSALDSAKSYLRHKRGCIVIFGVSDQILRFTGDLIFQLFNIRTHMTQTLESALNFIQIHDPTVTLPARERSLTEVTWFLLGHILYCYDVFTTEDIITRNRNAFELLKAEGKPPAVHLLIDFSSTNVENYSIDIRELVRRSTSSRAFEEARDNLIRHPLFGWVIAMNVHSPNINIGGKIVSQKYNYKRKEVDTLPDAIAFLKHIDPNIAYQLSRQPDNS